MKRKEFTYKDANFVMEVILQNGTHYRNGDVLLQSFREITKTLLMYGGFESDRKLKGF